MTNLFEQSNYNTDPSTIPYSYANELEKRINEENFDLEYEDKTLNAKIEEKENIIRTYTSEKEKQKLTPETKQQISDEAEASLFSAVVETLADMPVQAVAGLFDAGNALFKNARNMAEAIGFEGPVLQWTNDKGEWNPKYENGTYVKEHGGLKPLFPEIEKSEHEVANFTRFLTQFLIGFLPATKALKAYGVANKFLNPTIGGAVTDFFVFDPYEDRLSTFLNKVPGLREVVPDWLANTDPEKETEWEAKFKHVFDGIFTGFLGDAVVKGVFKTFKAYKAFRTAKGKAAIEEKANSILKHMKQKASSFEPIDEIDSFKVGKPSHKITPEELLETTDEGVVYLNTKNMHTNDDTRRIMKGLAQKAKDKLPPSKTHEGIKKASKKELQSLNDLLRRPANRPFYAEEAVAARDLLLASTNNIIALAKKITDKLDYTQRDLFEFDKAIAIHEDIQVKVLGGIKANAQALNAMGIKATSQKLRDKQIQALIEGRHGDITKLAKSIVDVAEKGGNVTKMAGQANIFRKLSDAHYQLWVNGLLSSPATHLVNFAGNTMTTIMAVPEKYYTAAFDRMMGNKAAFAEANAMLAAFLPGIKDGFLLMSGKVQDDLLTISSKFEKGRFQAITADKFGASPDSTVGKGIDYLGKMIGLPGWALQKSDDFFKGWNYRLKLQEQAAKQAFNEGLTGKAYTNRVKELIKYPSDAMRDVSIDFARYQTFTNPAGEWTKAMMDAVDATPGGRYVVPFIRTPANIFKYSFERTPLAPLMGDVRAQWAKGGSSRATVMARMSAGSMGMAAVAYYALNGAITGAGPSNWDERKALERTGWKPYSIKIGDTYYPYDRLDPLGSFLGYTADITSIMGQTDADESDSLVATGLAAFSKNFSSKTFMSGITRFIDVIESNNPKKWERYLVSMGANLVQPVGIQAHKKINQYFDPYKRDYTPDSVNGLLKSTFMAAQENIPGLGKDAPILRDIWARPLRYDNGIASPIDAISPIKISKVKSDTPLDKINQMIADNKIIFRLPRRRIDDIKLTNKQYDRYCLLAGTRAREIFEEEYEYGTFDGLSGGQDGELSAVMHRLMTTARQEARENMRVEIESERIQKLIELKAQQQIEFAEIMQPGLMD